MNITRIKAPKYKVGRYSLNEYELRCLMSEVVEGKKESGIKVTDEKRNTAIIGMDGRLTANLFGLDINSNYTINVLKINRTKKEVLNSIN